MRLCQDERRSEKTHGIDPDEKNLNTEREENPAGPGSDVDADEQCTNHDGTDGHCLQTNNEYAD